MGRVLWHLVMSLDGFTAGGDDDMEWIFGIDGGSGGTAAAIVDSAGAPVHRRRHRGGRPDRPRGGGWGRRDRPGANVARQCIEAELLDEIIIHLAPVLVGEGVRLFDRVDGAVVKLKPISTVVEGETTVLRYSVRGGAG